MASRKESTERWSGRTLYQDYQSGAWHGDRFWDVSGATTENDAYNATPINGSEPIAKPFEGHPQNKLLLAVNRTADRTGPQNWVIRAHYEIPNFNALAGGDSNLLKLPLKVSVRSGVISMPVDRDVFANAVLNSAMDPYQGIERPFPCKWITLTRYEPFYNIQFTDGFEQKVNQANTTFGRLFVPKGRLFCDTIGPAEEYAETAPAIPISYNFILRRSGKDLPEPFQLYLKDQGRRGWYKPTNSGNPVIGPLCYSNGVQVEDDVLLDGTGKPINPDIKVLDDALTPQPCVKSPNQFIATNFLDKKLSTKLVKFLKYYIAEETDFSQLRLK